MTCACSASRASAARWATPPRPSTTSTAPRTSTRGATPPAPTGSSAIPVGTRAHLAVRPHRLARAAPLRPCGQVHRTRRRHIFETDYADSRQLLSWVLGLGDQARILGARRAAAEERDERLGSWWTATPARPRSPASRGGGAPPAAGGHRRPRRRADQARALRAARHARRDAHRRRPRGRKLEVAELCERLQISDRSCARTSTC